MFLTDKSCFVNWVGDADRGQGPGNPLTAGATPAISILLLTRKAEPKDTYRDWRAVWSGILTAVPSGKPLFTRTAALSLRTRPDLTSGRTIYNVTLTHAVLIGGN